MKDEDRDICADLSGQIDRAVQAEHRTEAAGREVEKLKRERQHLRNVIHIVAEQQEAAEREVERLRDDYKELSRIRKAEAVDNLANERKLAKVLDGLDKYVPKLGEMIRMPNREWVADEHNAAIKALQAIIKEAERND